MIELSRWRPWALGSVSLAIAACTMDAGNKQAVDGGDDSVDGTGGIRSGGTSGLDYPSGGTSSQPTGGSSVGAGKATGGIRATGGVSTGPRSCSCACVCGTCTGSTNSGPYSKACGAGDTTCVDCYAPCREFCTSLSCSLVTQAIGNCS